MKILHTSDWHLGRLLHERSLIEDQEHALGQILSILKENEHDALVIAGDVFDRSIPTVEGVRLFGWFLAELRSSSPVPVLIIPGNHDSAARLSYCSELLSVSRVYIQGNPMRSAEPLVLGKNKSARVFMVPYLDQLVCPEPDDSEKKFSHEVAIESVLSRMLPPGGDGITEILVGHLFTAGGTASDSERKFMGTAGMVGSSLFERFDYTALGHLHRPQKITETVWYSGSPVKYSFSESGDTKQVLSVEIEKKSAEVRQMKIDPLRDMARISGKLADLLSGREHAPAEKCYCEAELTDDGLVSNPLALLRQRFPHILSVRQQAPASVFSERLIDSFSPERNIEDDFISFKQYLYGEKPDESEMKTFREIIREKESR